MQKFLSYTTKSTHHILLPSRINRDQSDGKVFQETITSLFIYPFSESSLVYISSGIVPTKETETHLMEVETMENKRWRNSTKVKVSNQVVQFSAQSGIFGKTYFKNKAIGCPLIRFLVRRWSSHCSVIGNSKMFIGFEERCILLDSTRTCLLQSWNVTRGSGYKDATTCSLCFPIHRKYRHSHPWYWRSVDCHCCVKSNFWKHLYSHWYKE